MTEGIVNIEILELEEALKVVNESFMPVAEEFGLTPENCPTNGAFIRVDKLLENYKKGNLCFGYYEQDKLVGYSEVSQIKDKEYAIEKLAVLPEMQHKGYGTKLVEHVLDLVKQLGGNAVFVGIINENTKLKEWYVKNGFTFLGSKTFEHLPFSVGFLKSEIV